MDTYITNDTDLTKVADAIREKAGVSGGLVYPDGFVSAVNGIQKANAKAFTFSSSAAVARKYVTLVSGDPDVANHYADDSARVTVTKMTNNNTVGTSIINVGNHACGNVYGAYTVVTNKSGTSSSATISHPISSSEGVTNTTPHIICNANGDIKVWAYQQNSNFGGADYLITFTW